MTDPAACTFIRAATRAHVAGEGHELAPGVEFVVVLVRADGATTEMLVRSLADVRALVDAMAPTEGATLLIGDVDDAQTLADALNANAWH